MTHDTAEIIYEQIVYFESLRKKQLQVILIGGNDIRKNKSPRKLLALFKNFMKQIVDVRGLHVVFGSLIPSPGTGSEDNENFKIFDFGLEDLVATFPREKFSFLNLTRAFRTRGKVMF
jgi:hypothetical protein